MLHRLIDRTGRDAGRAEWRETSLPGNALEVSFTTTLGYPRPTDVMTGSAALGPDLAWGTVDLANGGHALRLEPAAGEEVEVAGVPGFLALAARRLRAAGMRPGESRKVKLVHVDEQLGMRRVNARFTWLGGSSWSWDASGERTWFHMRLDGELRAIEGVAEPV